MPTVRTHVMIDLRGYARLMHQLGEAETKRRLRIYERIVRQELPSADAEVDHVADGFHMVFPSPGTAVRTAVGIAEALAKHNTRKPGANIPAGFGIEIGESPRSRAHRYIGRAPFVAARLCGRAHAGQVLLTDTVRALLPKAIPTRDLGVWQGKGTGAIHVYEARSPDRPEAATGMEARFLSALLFTDIVRSTSTAMGMGSHEWRELVERHHSIVREELERNGGSEIDTAGDGFYASFDVPSSAILCAQRLRERLRAVGLEVRVGIHVGECEVVAGKIGGIATVVAARVKDLADAAEILVSRTVRDAVMGTDFVFEEHGRHSLKGVPGEWEVYAVASSPKQTVG